MSRSSILSSSRHPATVPSPRVRTSGMRCSIDSTWPYSTGTSRSCSSDGRSQSSTSAASMQPARPGPRTSTTRPSRPGHVPAVCSTNSVPMTSRRVSHGRGAGRPSAGISGSIRAEMTRSILVCTASGCRMPASARHSPSAPRTTSPPSANTTASTVAPSITTARWASQARGACSSSIPSSRSTTHRPSGPRRAVLELTVQPHVVRGRASEHESALAARPRQRDRAAGGQPRVRAVGDGPQRRRHAQRRPQALHRLRVRGPEHVVARRQPVSSGGIGLQPNDGTRGRGELDRTQPPRPRPRSRRAGGDRRCAWPESGSTVRSSDHGSAQASPTATAHTASIAHVPGRTPADFAVVVVVTVAASTAPRSPAGSRTRAGRRGTSGSCAAAARGAAPA